MPDTADTVAKLNRMGGKRDAAHDGRFKARMSGMFSPQKDTTAPAAGGASRRTSGRLQSKRTSTSRASNGRRSSLSLSDDDTPQQSSTIEPRKRTRKALRKRSKKDEQSPLKKHGYNLKLAEGSKVNLDDSPSKNTRSRNHNPLETLAKANLPIPESLARPNKIQTTQEESESSSAASSRVHHSSAEETREHLLEKQENNPTANESYVPEHNEDEDEAVMVNTEEDPMLVEEDQDQDQDEHYFDADSERVAEPAQDFDVVNIDSSTQPKRKRGRPRKNADTAGDKQAKRLQEAAKLQAQYKEQLEEERNKFQDFKKKYAARIEDAINVHDCSEVWMILGATAYTIQAKSPPAASSARGKASIRTIKNCQAVYEAIREEQTSVAEHEERLKRSLNEVELRSSLLEKTDRPEDKDVVKDMYRFVIPELVMLLKTFLRARHHQRLSEASVVRELLRLIKASIRVCEAAQRWKDKPTTLEGETKRAVRNDITPSLRIIQEAFKSRLERRERIRADRLALERLAEKQAAARNAQLQRVEAIRRLKKQQWRARYARLHHESVMNNTGNGARKQEVYDVDEMEDYSSTRHVQGALPHREADSTMARDVEQTIRLTREPTADIPPPPSVNLSEDEKMALLNGLQKYTGTNRYSDIINDLDFGVYLKSRDLDDLMSAARSFSQMMVGKMGKEVYEADESLSWLRSVDASA